MAATKHDYTGSEDEPLPTADDPGGSRAKGYSADPEPGPPVPEEDPIPLAEAAPGAIRVPERESELPPTGRKESGDYTPNDRLMGADR